MHWTKQNELSSRRALDKARLWREYHHAREMYLRAQRHSTKERWRDHKKRTVESLQAIGEFVGEV